MNGVSPIITRGGLTFVDQGLGFTTSSLWARALFSELRPVPLASGALALGYFHCVTGMLRGGLTVLPKVRTLSEIPDER